MEFWKNQFLWNYFQIQSLKSAHGAESAARKAKREKEEESNRICKELEDLKQSHERQKGELKARDKELAALNLSKEDLNKHLQSSAQENEAAKQKIKALEVNFQLHFVSRFNMIRL